MKKNVLFVFVLFLTCIISCNKKKSDLNGQTLTYKESEVQKKLYLMDKIRSKTHKLKSFADEDREL